MNAFSRLVARLYNLLEIVWVIICILIIEGFAMQIIADPIAGRSHGVLVDTRYHKKERWAAYLARRQNPSPATEAAFQEEIRLMRAHPNLESVLGPPVFVLANGIGIFWYWRRRRRRLQLAADGPSATPSPNSITPSARS